MYSSLVVLAPSVYSKELAKLFIWAVIFRIGQEPSHLIQGKTSELLFNFKMSMFQ